MDHTIADNIICLQQGERLVASLDAEVYGKKVEVCFNSSIGGHLRHNLDHYFSFLAGAPKGRIDYDARARDAALETDPAAGREAFRQIIAGLEALPPEVLDKPLEVKMDTNNEADEVVWSHSTARRELQFLLSHSIHHYALIATMCRLLGRETPGGFGVAPSTLRYQQCAQ